MIKNKKGFTLIELIIVMAIIGILAVVAVIAIGSKSADARDARRLADMASVRTAMALSCSDGDTISVTTTTTTAHVIEICDASGSSYISFTNIHDPSANATCAAAVAGEGCASDASATCDYGFGAAADGGTLAIGTASIDPCNYRINFFQEGTDGAGYAADEGLVE